MARLGDLECAVMDVLWARCSPTSGGGGTGETGVTVREVAVALQERNLAYTTVMTVLDRLAGKGMVVRQRIGRAWSYRPAASREAYVAQLMMDALDLAGAAKQEGGAHSRDAALMRFARSVSGDEARVLRVALEEQADDQAGPDR